MENNQELAKSIAKNLTTACREYKFGEKPASIQKKNTLTMLEDIDQMFDIPYGRLAHGYRRRARYIALRKLKKEVEDVVHHRLTKENFITINIDVAKQTEEVKS